jgi:hypothetical protein
MRTRTLSLSLSALSLAALALLLVACGRRGEEAPSKAEPETPVDVSLTDRRLLYPSPPDMLLTAISAGMPSTGQLQTDVQALLERYLNGPVGETQVQPFPEDARLRAVFVLPGGVVVADLSSAARQGGGADTEMARVYGIVDTVVINFPEVRAVKILVEGQEVETLMGHVDLRRPLPPEMRILTPGLRPDLGAATHGTN